MLLVTESSTCTWELMFLAGTHMVVASGLYVVCNITSLQPLIYLKSILFYVGQLGNELDPSYLYISNSNFLCDVDIMEVD